MILRIVVMYLAPCIAWSAQPVLTHVHGRLPDDALPLVLQTDFYGNRFVKQVARYTGMTTREVATILQTRTYDLCAFDGEFESDGIVVDSNHYDIATITRTPYPKEVFACKDGKLLFSGTCGNAVRTQRGKVRVIKKRNYTPHCIARRTEYTERVVDTSPGIAVGGIAVGSDSTVTTFTYPVDQIVCTEE